MAPTPQPPKRRPRVRLNVSIVRASNLLAADVNLFGPPKSDPYCIAGVPGRPDKELKTEIIKKTLEPEWNFEGIIDEVKGGDPLHFQVFDFDRLRSDDPLGEVTLEWDEFYPNGFHGQLTLHEPETKPGKQDATIYVAIECVPIEHEDEDKPRCFVTVEGARGLKGGDFGGKSDPYVICGVPGKPRSKFRTKVVRDTVDPMWNEEDEVVDYELGDDVEFMVCDWDRTGTDDVLGCVTLSAEQFTPDGFRGTLGLSRGRLSVKVELYIPAPPEPVDPGAHVGPEDRRPAPFQLRSLDSGRVHRLSTYTAIGRSKGLLDPRYDLLLDIPVGNVDPRADHSVIKAWCGVDPSIWGIRIYSDRPAPQNHTLARGFLHSPGATVDNVPVDPEVGTDLEPGSILRFGYHEMWVLERAAVYKKSAVGEVAYRKARSNASEDPASFRELRVPSSACNYAIQHCRDWDSVVRVVLEWCGEPDEPPCVDIIEVLDEIGRLVARHEARTVQAQENFNVAVILREVRLGCTLRVRLSSDPCLLAPILGKQDQLLKKTEEVHHLRSQAIFGGFG